MNTIFMNSRKSKTSDLHRLVVNLSDIIVNMFHYQIIVSTIHGKNLKTSY